MGRLLRDQARAWIQARQGAEWPDQIDEYGSVNAADPTGAADNEWRRFTADTDGGMVEVSSEFGQAAEVAPIFLGVSSGANGKTGAYAEMSSRLSPTEVQTLADRLIERAGRQP